MCGQRAQLPAWHPGDLWFLYSHHSSHRITGSEWTPNCLPLPVAKTSTSNQSLPAWKSQR